MHQRHTAEHIRRMSLRNRGEIGFRMLDRLLDLMDMGKCGVQQNVCSMYVSFLDLLNGEDTI